MKLSVVIPVYNENDTIRNVVNQVIAVDIEKEIRIVDDCSTVGTRNILKELQDDGLIVVLHEKNMSKGAVLRT